MPVTLTNQDIFDDNIDVIIHQANCMCCFGAGIAKEIKKRYPRAYQVDKLTQKGDHKKLGQFTVAFPDEDQDKYVVNLYGQFRYGRDKCYTDYKAVRRGLENLSSWLEKMNLTNKTVGIPKFMGCKNAGGDWIIVEQIIREIFEDSKIRILICAV